MNKFLKIITFTYNFGIKKKNNPKNAKIDFSKKCEKSKRN